MAWANSVCSHLVLLNYQDKKETDTNLIKLSVRPPLVWDRKECCEEGEAQREGFVPRWQLPGRAVGMRPAPAHAPGLLS